MKIKLIAPARKPEWGESFWDLKTLCRLTGRKAGGAPLALPTIAALTPKDVEVILTDESVEPINFDEKIDLVGITGMTSVIPRAYEIADEFKRRGIQVVMGGIHVSMLPNEAITHCDAVVIGEAEGGIWEQVVKDAQENKLLKFYKSEAFPDLSNSPSPRWDLMKYKLYPVFQIQIGRGCPYDCEFCAVQKFNGRQYRARNIDNVLEEIRLLKQREDKKPFFFVDDNILSNKEKSKIFLNRLIPFNIQWWCQAAVENLLDDALLDLMYKSGCREVFVGFESVQSESLNAIRKTKNNKTHEYKEIVNKVQSHGIAVFGSFILGTDSDTINIFDETARFIEETNTAFSMINILTPLPGTILYQKLSDQNRLLNKGWHSFNAEDVTFTPMGMSKEQLLQGRIRLCQNIYSLKNLYKRLSHLWDNGVFLRSALLKNNFFSKGKLLFTFSAIFKDFSIAKSLFILKCLWKRRNKTPSIMSVLLAISFHNYAFKPESKK